MMWIVTYIQGGVTVKKIKKKSYDVNCNLHSRGGYCEKNLSAIPWDSFNRSL